MRYYRYNWLHRTWLRRLFIVVAFPVALVVEIGARIIDTTQDTAKEWREIW